MKRPLHWIALTQTGLLLVLGTMSPCSAQKTDPMAGMPGMAGMSMGIGAVKIPAGANYIAADVEFMQGMIGHHTQAVVMAAMAASHGANPQMLKFTQKIAQSQTGEILAMKNWLADREQPVPDSAQIAAMRMPGILTPQQMKDLDEKKGKEFDRQFLLDMIVHHEGALKMVADLAATPLSMQEPVLAGFGPDIDATQRAEILKMQQMLAELN